MFSDRDLYWMQSALRLAQAAAEQQEVPVGAILTLEDKIIGEGYNSPIDHRDPTAHAEILALREGARRLKNYRLPETTLYVTLEPCLMCVGALVHARVKRVVFGACDPKGGAVVSVFSLGESHLLNHQVDYQGGLLSEKCGHLLSDFFRARR
jgi:tRNA(adenine34) deaminase